MIKHISLVEQINATIIVERYLERGKAYDYICICAYITPQEVIVTGQGNG